MPDLLKDNVASAGRRVKALYQQYDEKFLKPQEPQPNTEHYALILQIKEAEQEFEKAIQAFEANGEAKR